MTTFAKTWVTDGNRVPGDQSTAANWSRWLLWYIHSLLTNTGLSLSANTGAWAVDQCCDSVTVNTTGTDLWTTTFTASKIVNAAAGSAHSWIVLSRTFGSTVYYLTIDYNSATATVASFFLSKTRPSGGTTTAAPTAADALSFSAQSFCQTTTLASHVHGNLATDGSFDILVSTDGSGKFNLAFGVNALGSPKSGDVMPLAFYLEFSTTGVCTAATWISTGLIKMRDKSNASTVAVAACSINFVSGNVMTDMGTTDGESGNYDDAPILLYSNTAAHKSIRGQLLDIAWAPTSSATGLTEPASGATQSMVVGNMWHPWISVGAGPIL